MTAWSEYGVTNLLSEEQARLKWPWRCSVCGDTLYQWAGRQGFVHATFRAGRQCGMTSDIGAVPLYIIEEQTLI